MTVAIGTQTVIVADRLSSTPDGRAGYMTKLWTRGPWALALAGDYGIISRTERTALTGDEPDFLERLSDEILALESRASGATVEYIACHAELGAFRSEGVGFKRSGVCFAGYPSHAEIAWLAIGRPTDAAGLRSVVNIVGAVFPLAVGGGTDVLEWDGSAWVAP